jgi:hypothetical protein
MRSTLDERLKEMIAALKNWQEFLSESGYPGSAQLLEVAALDLKMKLHNISDAELRAFCDAVRRKRVGSTKLEHRPSKLGPHFSGSRGLTPAQNVIIMRSVKTAHGRKTKNRG